MARPAAAGSRQDAHELNNIGARGLGSKRILHFQSDQVASVAERNFRFEAQFPAQFSEKLRARPGSSNDKSARGADIHDVIGGQFSCQHAGTERSVASNVDASQEDNERHSCLWALLLQNPRFPAGFPRCHPFPDNQFMAPDAPDQIQHVSDTALMVAACRALETARTDGLVRDPFAERLAGPRGDAILHGITGWQLMCFGIGVRTRFLDNLVVETIARESIEVVLSIGAGLDTRPWRLELPPDLRWIEADFPEMLSYKTRAMADEQPKCRLERMAADVTNEAQRGALFTASVGAPALMITEGLLMYLTGAVVEALAADAVRHGIRRWLLDTSSLDLARIMGLDARGAIANVRAPGHLQGPALLDAVRSNGWTQLRFRSYSRDAAEVAAERIAAMMRPFVEKGMPVPAAPVDDSSGVYLFGRE